MSSDSEAFTGSTLPKTGHKTDDVQKFLTCGLRYYRTDDGSFLIADSLLRHPHESGGACCHCCSTTQAEIFARLFYTDFLITGSPNFCSLSRRRSEWWPFEKNHCGTLGQSLFLIPLRETSVKNHRLFARHGTEPEYVVRCKLGILPHPDPPIV